MKSTLDTVAFFKTLRETLESLNDKDAGRLMKCLFAYDDGEDPDMAKASPVVKAIFPLVAEPLDRLTKMRMNKARPQTNRKRTANEPQTDSNADQTESKADQTDRIGAYHNHNHNHILNHPSYEGNIGRNPKVQKAFGFSTERTDGDYDEIARRLREEREAAE